MMQKFPSTFSIIGQSNTLRPIFHRITAIATSDTTVLLVGETGVGKEIIAEFIHRNSSRSAKPLIKVGLSTLPPELLESELFGHEKGAYTNALSEKKGLFELANTGTIFLDDIDDFPLYLQSKLLRVLESREIMRVGGMKIIPVDVRVISASKVDLRELVSRCIFRPDLYYRINIVPIVIPPLRERRDEIAPLVDFFLQRYAPDKQLTIDKQTMELLEQYSWPGNIRELRNVIQRISIFANEIILPSELPQEIRNENHTENFLKQCGHCITEGNKSFEEVVSCVETNILRDALKKSDGIYSQAARMLKMSLSTFRDKVKKYHLDNHTI
jgi:transcriptional regulator with GAF, ATPase, and Fis domain